MDDLNTVSDRIQSAANAHNEAMKKLGSGRGNALGRAEKLKALGVKPKKDFPLIVIDGEKQAIESDDGESGPLEALAVGALTHSDGPGA